MTLKITGTDGTVGQVLATDGAGNLSFVTVSGAGGGTGPSGPAGAIGATGVAGPAGSVGTAGPAGPAGTGGTVGPSGPSGPTGSQGPIGITGPTGPTGLTGSQGNQGSQGNVGATGVAGPQGNIGATGAKGATGSQGPQGNTGITGPAGPAGPAGPSGPQGPQGNQGNTGVSGPQGPGANQSLNTTNAVTFTGVTINGPLTVTGAMNFGTQATILTPSGTSTWVIPTGIRKVKVTVVAGGGPGGNSSFSGQTAVGGAGGNSGATVIKWLTGLTPGNTLTYYVGRRGYPDDERYNYLAAENSTVSSGSQSITSIVALAFNNRGYGTADGITSSGGDIIIEGVSGLKPGITYQYNGGGTGASTPFGTGGRGGTGASQGSLYLFDGWPGTGAGSGGGGGWASWSYNQNPGYGGLGADGMIIFEY